MNDVVKLPVSSLYPSELNPRRSNNRQVMELANSLRTVGFIHPLTVRFNARDGADYEIICGERRFLASIEAAIFDIPCIVRDLSDTEAVEIMITENLQRLDITPLDEAGCFHRLLLSDFGVDEICLKSAKSGTFVRSRLKLMDLGVEFRELLDQELISISMALEICKLTVKDQTELYKEKFSTALDTPNFTPLSLRELKNFIEYRISAKLEKALFSLDDALLDPVAGACTTCQFNSSSMMVLFPDSKDTGICYNKACLSAKNTTFLNLSINKLITEQPGILIGKVGNLYDKAEELEKYLNNSNIAVTDLGRTTGYTQIEKPYEPQKPSPSDYTSGAKDPEYKEDLKSYKEEVSEFKTELAEFEEAIQADDVVKAFLLNTQNHGTVQYFKLPAFKDHVVAPDNFETASKLTAKRDRNAELEFEKCYLAIAEFFYKSNYTNETCAITFHENKAFFDVICNYYAKQKLEFTDEQTAKLYEAPIIIPSDEARRAFRKYLLNELQNTAPICYKELSENLLVIVESFYPADYNRIVDPIKAAYLKRNNSIAEKLKAL